MVLALLLDRTQLKTEPLGPEKLQGEEGDSLLSSNLKSNSLRKSSRPNKRQSKLPGRGSRGDGRWRIKEGQLRGREGSRIQITTMRDSLKEDMIKDMIGQPTERMREVMIDQLTGTTMSQDDQQRDQLKGLQGPMSQPQLSPPNEEADTPKKKLFFDI